MKNLFVLLFVFVFFNANTQTMPVSYKQELQISLKKDKLVWETASESNNLGFYVLCSKDGESFKEVGFVEGLNKPSYYEFEVKDFDCYFKLKQVDYDGKVEFSKMVFNSKKGKDVLVYPNPFNQNIFVPNSEVEIYDEKGQLLFKTSGKQQLNLSFLKNGIYFLKTENKTIPLLKVN